MDDHLLLPAEEPEIAVLVGPSEIARVEPVVGHDLFGRLRRLPVAGHAAAASDPDPADLPGLDRLALLLAQGDGEPADRLPIEPCLISPEGGLSVAKPTSVIPYPSTIGNPAMAANSVRSSVETLSAPGAADPKRGEVARLQVVVVDQRRERRGDHRQDRRLDARAAAAAARGRRLPARPPPCRRPRASRAPRGRSRCGTSRSRAGRHRRRRARMRRPRWRSSSAGSRACG